MCFCQVLKTKQTVCAFPNGFVFLHIGPPAGNNLSNTTATARLLCYIPMFSKVNNCWTQYIFAICVRILPSASRHKVVGRIQATTFCICYIFAPSTQQSIICEGFSIPVPGPGQSYWKHRGQNIFAGRKLLATFGAAALCLSNRSESAFNCFLMFVSQILVDYKYCSIYLLTSPD